MDEKVFYSIGENLWLGSHESNDEVLLFNKKEDYEIAVQLMWGSGNSIPMDALSNEYIDMEGGRTERKGEEETI
jgi:hypothetical protein